MKEWKENLLVITGVVVLFFGLFLTIYFGKEKDEYEREIKAQSDVIETQRQMIARQDSLNSKLIYQLIESSKK